MGRTFISATLASCIAIFFYKPEGGSNIAWTSSGIPSKSDGVTVLVRHVYLYGSARAPVAPKAKTLALLGVKGRAEKHERIDTTNRVV